MNKPSKPMGKPMSKPAKPRTRRIRVETLINVGATFGAAVLFAAMSGAKRPIMGGD